MYLFFDFKNIFQFGQQGYNSDTRTDKVIGGNPKSNVIHWHNIKKYLCKDDISEQNAH